MKLLIQSAMIFFGTLMAAGFVALGEPASPGIAPAVTLRPAAHARPVMADARPVGQDAARSRR